MFRRVTEGARRATGVTLLNTPQSIQPGTKMPKFFREGEFQDYIPGTPEEQTEAMKDYLMNLWE